MDSSSTALVLVSVALSSAALAVALSAVIYIWCLHGRRKGGGKSQASGNSTLAVAPLARTYTAYWPPQDPMGLMSNEFGPQRNVALTGAAPTRHWTSQGYGQERPAELFMHTRGVSEL